MTFRLAANWWRIDSQTANLHKITIQKRHHYMTLLLKYMHTPAGPTAQCTNTINQFKRKTISSTANPKILQCKLRPFRKTLSQKPATQKVKQVNIYASV